ncbi:Bifunctional inhibitor/plant lipid transfer protein/seed storage helical domain-containing protein, partial [Cynara cardunculus var. scolymus]
MTSFSTPPTTTTLMTVLLLLMITYLPSPTTTQPNPPLNPTIAECAPRILPLASCAPFVQAISKIPTQLCCDNLRHVNDLQPRCLCLLLNNTALSASFPINTTLAMQLPFICSVRFDIVSCSGATPLPSASPTPLVSLGSTTNSTVACNFTYGNTHSETWIYGIRVSSELRYEVRGTVAAADDDN